MISWIEALAMHFLVFTAVDAALVGAKTYNPVSEAVCEVFYPGDASEKRRGTRWIPDEKLKCIEFVDEVAFRICR